MKRKIGLLTEGYNGKKLRKCSSVPLSPSYKMKDRIMTFDDLPLEMKYKVFSYLEISDLCNLCRTCKSINTIVGCYAGTRSCVQTKQFHQPHAFNNQQSNFIKQYRNIGMLYKVIMADCSFTLHLDFLSQVLKKHICFNYTNETSQESEVNRFHCINQQSCQSMTHFGFFLREFITNWNENQSRRLFQTLIQHCFESNFWKKFTRLLFKFPGSDIKEELMVRLFLRRVFLNADCYMDSLDEAWNIATNESSDRDVKFVNQEEVDNFERTKEPSSKVSTKKLEKESVNSLTKSKCNKRNQNYLTLIWLNEIITSYTIGHQAKILFILYGPLHKDKLMWNAMCENTAADANQVSACFGEIGWAMRLLQVEHWWSEFDTISALEEVTSVPDEWLAENIACLLYTTGYAIATQYISYKSINGLSSEVAIILTSMCLVQVKLGTNFKNVLALVDKACSSATSKRDRRFLLDKLAVSFQDVIVDLYETDEIDNRLEDFSTLLKAQASFVRAIFRRMYED